MPGISPVKNISVSDCFKSKKISILMPFLNEEAKIVENVNEVKTFLDSLGLSYEIVLIDDGSTDNSYNLLIENFKDSEKIKIVKNFLNFGKGWALKTGYEISTGDLILFLDSDLELSPAHLPNFLKIMEEENADAVIGSKLHPDSVLEYPFYRKILSYGYYSFVRVLFGLPIMDTQTGIKLFKREALELSLPKVLVKRFAFDIELLLILHKSRKKIVSAPIELKFSRGKFGWNFKFEVILKTFWDTFAIFYRDKILKFYDRPFGENKKFFYSIVLFSEKNDDFEKYALSRFQNLLYPNYEIILVGSEKIFSEKDYKFLQTETDKTEVEKLKLLLESGLIKGEILVFSRLNSFPDERFLYNACRVLSLEDVGCIGGYLIPSPEAKKFEDISYKTLNSIFLNFNLAFRYKPLNFRKVKELHMNGIFVKKEILKFEKNYREEKRLEHLISEMVLSSGKKIYYSPDIMLYHKFPTNLHELLNYIKQNSISRAEELKEIILKRKLKNLSTSFFIPFVFFALIFSTLVSMNKTLGEILLFYYFILILSRIVNYGAINGIFLSFLLSILQIVYCFFYIIGLFRFKNK